MSPGAIIKSYGIDRDLVVRAINFRYDAKWRNGLCFTFENIGMHGAYETVPRMLTDLNDRTDLLPNYDSEVEMGFGFEYYCPDIGNNQRLMLLAFMLTWLEDEDD